MTKPKILTGSWHPAPGRTMSILAQKMNSDDLADVVNVAHEHAAKVLAERKVPYRTPISYADVLDLSASSMRKLLKQESPQLVVVGSSAQDLEHRDILEHSLTLAAKAERIPSISVVDGWMLEEYARLVSDVDARNKVDSSGKFRYVPDWMAIPDAAAKSEMVAEGFPEQILVPTGSPVWDELVSYRGKFTSEKRAEVRKTWQISDDTYVITVFSQPIELQFGNGKGYTEKDMHREIISNYKSAESTGKQTALVFRAHPRELQQEVTLDVWAARLNELAKEYEIRTIVIDSGKFGPNESIAASDAFVSMVPLSVFDGAFLGKPTISLQPGLREDLRNNIITRTGLVLPIYDSGKVGEVLERLVSDRNYHDELASNGLRYPGLDGKATERVIGLIYEKLGIRS